MLSLWGGCDGCWNVQINIWVSKRSIETSPFDKGMSIQEHFNNRFLSSCEVKCTCVRTGSRATATHLPLIYFSFVRELYLLIAVRHIIIQTLSTLALTNKTNHYGKSELNTYPITQSLSSTKRASLYHGSCVLGLDSLPAGQLCFNCSLHALSLDWVMCFHEPCGHISYLTHDILSSWHLHPSNASL